jgi:LuxR family transcriptional regulator, maltose regulon positive regulatory protein
MADALEPDMMPVLRRRAAGWFLDNGRPEEALEYSMAAGDADTAARLVQKLWLAADRQGRIATFRRWFRWLEDQGGIKGHPMLAVQGAFLGARVGSPAEAERWAEVLDRWQDQDAARPADPSAEAWAAMVRTVLCRRGVEQMRADADEAARRLAAENIVAPVASLAQGVARVLCGDPGGADAFLQDTASAAEDVGAHEVRAITLCERSLVAMAGGEWGRAKGLAGQARSVLRQAGIEDSYTTPLAGAVQARVALHRGDVPAARRELVPAQRLRSLLTYALPHLAVQARIELIRVHLALADLAGARTLMREVDDVLRRRLDLGTLASEAAALRAQLARQRGTVSAGASALTAAELRLLPLLSTHLSLAEIAAELFLSPNTAKTHAVSIYRKLGAGSRGQAVARARELGLLEG